MNPLASQGRQHGSQGAQLDLVPPPARGLVTNPCPHPASFATPLTSPHVLEKQLCCYIVGKSLPSSASPGQVLLHHSSLASNVTFTEMLL